MCFYNSRAVSRRPHSNSSTIGIETIPSVEISILFSIDLFRRNITFFQKLFSLRRFLLYF